MARVVCFVGGFVRSHQRKFVEPSVLSTQTAFATVLLAL